ncbi:MAG: hypothetical protein J1E41_03380 [Ruminococcus sp.]|nr:hypothetical protein [Ruminococcus sp.]
MGIYVEIVIFITVIIGTSMYQVIEDNLTNRSFIKRKAIAALIGLATWIVISVLGIGSILLFFSHHPIIGSILAVAFLFFIVLCIFVVVKLFKKAYTKK